MRLCVIHWHRSVDRRRARQIQIKKREGLSEMDDSREGRSSEGKSSSSSLLSSIQLSKKKRKKGKVYTFFKCCVSLISVLSYMFCRLLRDKLILLNALEETLLLLYPV